MGWGTEFNIEMFLSKKTFRTLYEVECDIETNKGYIESNKKKILMFASANIQDIIDPEWKEEPINWLYNQINRLLEDNEEMLIENYNLELYAKYIEEKCGGIIPKIKPEDL